MGHLGWGPSAGMILRAVPKAYSEVHDMVRFFLRERERERERERDIGGR